MNKSIIIAGYFSIFAGSMALGNVDLPISAYTDQSGVTYFQFDEVPRVHSEAVAFCQSRNMSLPSLEELQQDLWNTLKLDRTQLLKWLDGRNQLVIWSSAIPDDAMGVNEAWFLDARKNGVVKILGHSRDDLHHVRCVSN